MLKQFALYSSYKFNLHKSQILTFNYEPDKDISRSSKFKWNTQIGWDVFALSGRLLQGSPDALSI